jgi:hypothetical protein
MDIMCVCVCACTHAHLLCMMSLLQCHLNILYPDAVRMFSCMTIVQRNIVLYRKGSVLE